MNYMKHFLVLFFDEKSRAFLHETSRRLYSDYAPGRTFPEIEHHLTIQYFQCDERFYPEVITEVEQVLGHYLPIAINLSGVHEYVNEMNNFCCLSLLAQKTEHLLQLHDQLTQPLDKLHLHHEPSAGWPPHITCFPGLTLKDRPKNWHLAANKHLIESAPILRGTELRFTRWTGTHIETLHRFSTGTKVKTATQPEISGLDGRSS